MKGKKKWRILGAVVLAAVAALTQPEPLVAAVEVLDALLVAEQAQNAV